MANSEPQDLDAKLQDASSSEVSADAITDSSSEVQKDANTPVSDKTDDIVDAVIARHPETDSESSTDKVAEKSETPDKPKQEPKAKEEPLAEPVKGKEKKPSFQDHPDWIKREERIKTFEKENTDLKARVKTLDDTQAWCQTNGITQESYTEVLQVRAMIGSADPETAKRGIDMAEKAILATKERLGLTLPADLQKAVEDGRCDMELAKSIAKGRVEANSHKALADQYSRLNVEQQEAVVQSQLAGWINSKFQTDPAFKQSHDGNDGLFEDVARRMQTECTNKINAEKRPLSPAEMVQIAEGCYQKAKAYQKALMPTPTARKAPLNGSSRNSPDVSRLNINDNDSIIDAVAAKYANGL